MGVEVSAIKPGFTIRRFNEETQQFDTYVGTPVEENVVVSTDHFTGIVYKTVNSDYNSRSTVIPHHHDDLKLILEEDN